MKKLIALLLLTFSFFLFTCPAALPQSVAPALIPFEMMPDSLGHTTTLVPQACPYVNAYALAANTAQTVTVPAGACWMILSCASPYYLSFTTAAAIPTTSVTNGSASFPGWTSVYIGPSAAWPTGVSSFSVIAAASAELCIAFYGN